MKPPPFSYHRPDSVDEALGLLATLDDPKILAGGQSLMPMMNFRYVMPANLIDINRIEDLSRIEDAGDTLRIGAMARQRALEFSDLVRARCPLLHAALLNVGHVQTRNRGTIGGSLSHLDPAAELPAALMALDATMHVGSKRGTRDVAIADWAMGYMTPNLEMDEMLTAITIPVWPDGHGAGFVEFARRHGDFAMAGTAAMLALSPDRTIERAALAVTGVDVGPVRLHEAEAMLTGQTPSDTLFADAAQSAGAVPGLDDVHASKEYRRKLAIVMTKRALAQAHAQIQGGGGDD
jgi:carbon-monoxide dehydrogenase medium subunit